MRTHFFRSLLLAALAAALAACSPTYNWRVHASTDAPFSATFPDKPATHKRMVDLNGLKVEMLMTGAQVNGVTFAVGTAEAPDAAQAEAALQAMKTALVRNIGGTVTSEKASAAAAGNVRTARIDLAAKGSQKGVPLALSGRFESKGKRFYQAIVLGPEKEVTKENVDMFLSSFTLH